jgi:hypothetical protein
MLGKIKSAFGSVKNNPLGFGVVILVLAVVAAPVFVKLSGLVRSKVPGAANLPQIGA